MPKPTDKPSLADLRAEIDRIDEGMHNLLMQRGEIIDRLIVTNAARKPVRRSAPHVKPR